MKGVCELKSLDKEAHKLKRSARKNVAVKVCCNYVQWSL